MNIGISIWLNGVAYSHQRAASSTVNAQGSKRRQADTKKWQHSFEIYALALNIRGERYHWWFVCWCRCGSLHSSWIILIWPTVVAFKNIYDNQWGYYIDYSFMKLSGKTNSVLGSNLKLLERQSWYQTRCLKMWRGLSATNTILARLIICLGFVGGITTLMPSFYGSGW